MAARFSVAAPSAYQPTSKISQQIDRARLTLERLPSASGPLLSSIQVDQILGLTRDINVILELSSLLYRFPFNEVIKLLTNNKGYDAIWNSPLFDEQRKRELINEEIFLDRKEAVKGLAKCSKCGGEEFVIEGKQTTSADEGMKARLKCIFCGQGMRLG